MGEVRKIRFPNESFYDEITTFRDKDFKLIKKIGDSSFGWWKGIYIEILKK